MSVMNHLQHYRLNDEGVVEFLVQEDGELRNTLPLPTDLNEDVSQQLLAALKDGTEPSWLPLLTALMRERRLRILQSDHLDQEMRHGSGLNLRISNLDQTVQNLEAVRDSLRKDIVRLQTELHDARYEHALYIDRLRDDLVQRWSESHRDHISRVELNDFLRSHSLDQVKDQASGTVTFSIAFSLEKIEIEDGEDAEDALERAAMDLWSVPVEADLVETDITDVERSL